MNTDVRHAKPNDLPAINDIYNECVVNSTATFDLVPRTIDRARIWFEQHDDRFAVLVVNHGGQVAGWASLSRWSDRSAYDSTGECSVYVKADARRLGLGRSLQESLVCHARSAGFRTILAQITTENEVSVRMHKKLGFEEVGILRSVGYKFDRWLDVCLMQLIL